VHCDCSFSNGTVCHVTEISLEKQNFSGELPPDFADFPNLPQLDLSRNLFHGGVPDQWARMNKLQGLSMMGNRLSGPFLMVLTKITTLTNLSIEGNEFHGPISPEIGGLIRMQKLILSANEFTGPLPTALSLFSNLTDLRISSTNFSGRMPDFWGKLKRLEKLQIEGSLLQGPIPLSLSELTNLYDLRISDLRGSGSAFPDLSGMQSMKTLVLRKCSISGSIPSYIGSWTTLKHLYLTGNSLTGNIPGWILRRNKIADISFNNFTVGNSGPSQCLPESVNLVESYSPEMNSLNSVQPCLKRNFPCVASNGQHRSSLHINCGDKEATINGIKYEADTTPKGASLLYVTPGSKWAFSSTGNFMDDNINDDNYIATSASKLAMPNSELYSKARLSPLSLTYYGLCMLSGSYTVNLHFAEIVFTNDTTYCSLGKRRFNVFIQGRMVLENFNIEQSSGAAGKPVIKTFQTHVTNHTLEIQFYWAGRGTTGIPYRGSYGPLISAISVTPRAFTMKIIILKKGVIYQHNDTSVVVYVDHVQISRFRWLLNLQ